MARSRILLIIIVGAFAAAIASPAASQDPKPSPAPEKPAERVALAYRFPPLAGKTAIYEAERTVTSTVEAEGTDEDGRPLKARRQSITTMITTIAVTFAKCGETEARAIVEKRRLRVRATTDAGEAAFDSDDPPKDPSAISPELKEALAPIGQKVSLAISKRGDIGKLESATKPKPKVEELRGTFLKFPEAPCAIGEPWTSKQRAPFPPIGELVTTFTNRLARTDGDGDARRARIETTIAIVLEPAKSVEAPPVLLRDGGGKGHTIVDANGLLVEEETETRMTLVPTSGQGATRPTQTIDALSRQRLLALEDSKENDKR